MSSVDSQVSQPTVPPRPNTAGGALSSSGPSAPSSASTSTSGGISLSSEDPGASVSTQRIQLSDLQNILSGFTGQSGSYIYVTIVDVIS